MQLPLVIIAFAATVSGGLSLDETSTDGGPGRADACDQVLPAGGDAATFINGLGAGTTGCLRGGVHRAADVATIEAPRVTLRSYPGERATLVGRLWVEAGADRTVVEGLTLNGRNSAAKPSPTITADRVVFRNNDVTNDHTAICFGIGNDRYGDADGTLIEGNRIHDCGRLPPTNHEHGIYISHATDTTIRGNVIHDNADRGVQMYPDADRTVVVGNVIDGNGQGVIFGGDEDEASDDNLVTGNLIVDSRVRYNVLAHWQGPVGSGNVARDNCVWIAPGDYSGSPPGSGIEEAMGGARAFDNEVLGEQPVEAMDLAPDIARQGCETLRDRER